MTRIDRNLNYILCSYIRAGSLKMGSFFSLFSSPAVSEDIGVYKYTSIDVRMDYPLTYIYDNIVYEIAVPDNLKQFNKCYRVKMSMQIDNNQPEITTVDVFTNDDTIAINHGWSLRKLYAEHSWTCHSINCDCWLGYCNLTRIYIYNEKKYRSYIAIWAVNSMLTELPVDVLWLIKSIC